MRYYLAERLKENHRAKTLQMEAFCTGSVLVGAFVVLVVVAGFLVLMH